MAELGLEPVAVNDPLSSHPSFFGSRGEQFAVIGGSFFEPNLEDIAATACGSGSAPAEGGTVTRALGFLLLQNSGGRPLEAG